MSLTIITKSKSEFFTSVGSEKLIGELCKLVKAKYTDVFEDQRTFYIKNNPFFLIVGTPPLNTVSARKFQDWRINCYY